MKYCTKCGARAHDEDNFCGKCGERFDMNGNINTPPNVNNSNPETKMRTNSTVSLTFGIISLFALIIALFWFSAMGVITLGLGIPGIVLGAKSCKLGVGKAGLICSIFAVAGLVLAFLITTIIAMIVAGNFAILL